MKSTLRPLLKIALLTLPLSLSFSGSAIAQARDRSVLSPGPIRPGHLDYRPAFREGVLIVYSATEESNDGGVPYHAHSSYAIYTSDGKLFKKVENHVSPNDEVPEIVTLPVGVYMIEARSEKDGYVRVPVAINEGRRTILNLELWESKARFARNSGQSGG
jgi:hypothetical protein